MNSGMWCSQACLSWSIRITKYGYVHTWYDIPKELRKCEYPRKLKLKVARTRYALLEFRIEYSEGGKSPYIKRTKCRSLCNPTHWLTPDPIYMKNHFEAISEDLHWIVDNIRFESTRRTCHSQDNDDRTWERIYCISDNGEFSRFTISAWHDLQIR